MGRRRYELQRPGITRTATPNGHFRCLGLSSHPGHPAESPVAMVRAYFFSSYPGSERSSNVASFRRRFDDESDPLRLLCGFSGTVLVRSTFSRAFRRLDAQGDSVDDVSRRLPQLLLDRPWVVTPEPAQPKRSALRGMSDDYRRIRERVGLGFEDFVDLIPDDAAAEARLIKQRWPHGVRCPDRSSGGPAEHLPDLPRFCPTNGVHLISADATGPAGGLNAQGAASAVMPIMSRP